MDKLEEQGGDGVAQKNLPALGKKTRLPRFAVVREGGPEKLAGAGQENNVAHVHGLEGGA